MIKIAITGGIACGKSLIGAYMNETGLAVLEADSIGHELLNRRDIYDKIVSCFGKGVARGDCVIDRTALGRVVFSDRKRLRTLNSILHPEIRLSWTAWLNDVDGSGCRGAAVVVPLLFETGYDRGWDFVVCVTADRFLQVERLRERGLTRGEAEQRLGAQMPTECKVLLSDRVIINNWSREVAKQQTEYVLKGIMGDAYGNQER